MATPILQVENLSKSFGDLLLFEHVSFGMTEGQHVGLIGRNGCGKSTLLGLLAGLDSADDGKITYRKDVKVGYLPQIPVFHEGETVWQACSRVISGEEEELRAKQLLTQLGITDFQQLISELSGGKQKCVALASALLSAPDFLMMDEPTNHLDLSVIEWLEDYLKRNKVSLLMVTHDRYFLDRICTDILEIDAQRVYAYQGNYSYYLEKRQERLDAKQVEVVRANNLYRTELEWMRRMPQARGHKARYREEAFYELEKVAKQRFDERNVRLEVKSAYIGKKIFEADHLFKSFGDKKILDDFSYIFARYEKMGIVGNNGTGKSTFLKILLGQLQPDKGSLDIGETVRFGYYSQDGLHFNEQMKVIDVVRDIAEVVNIGGGQKLGVSQFLQYFLFTPEQQYNYVYKLSGGEKRRLYLCTVLMRNPNFLILDEPTNDLDIITLNVLEEYLKNFGGCLIVVSHDRYFMDKVVDHLLVFNGEGDIRDFPGNYTQYRAWKEEKLRHDREQEKQRDEKPLVSWRQRENTKRRLSFKERREMEQLEVDIAALEEEKKSLETALCSGQLSTEELTEKSKRLPALNEELDEKSMRWLELSEIEN
ncbi:MAG: ABC-F family ATP-binding cassette domain-containing protein [Bacteroidaceae bacterium]|nr:ABC-F family ATP-binding cassette domain-containing protein [Bacteroidaceae bacterium]